MRTLTGTAVLAAAAVALVGCGNVSFGGTRHEDRSYDAPWRHHAEDPDAREPGRGDRVRLPGITVNERLSWSNEKNKPTAKHTVEGRAQAHLQVRRPGDRVQPVRRLLPHPGSALDPVQIDNKDGSIVASGLAGTVKLHSDNGSITATDLRASTASLSSNDGSLRVSGRVTTADLSSNNGSVDASGLTADTLKARSKDGRIRLSGNVTTADLDTSNGSIDAHGLTVDRLTAETKDGGINLRLTAPPTSVKATSANGSVHLRLPVGETYAISVSTDNGSKRIDPALHQDSQSKRRIELDTKDGSVSVEPSRG